MIRFADSDLVAIRQAVQAAERRTRGEIVPMVVPASARYREAWHLTGLLSALVALAILLMVEFGWTPWTWAYHPGWILIGVVMAYLIGSAVGTQPWCIRLLTAEQRMAMKVRRRAESAFYEHGLHRTHEGTGILIMLSLLERRVEILADRAINERLPPGTWDGVVQDLVQGLRRGQPAAAMCAAITRCADLLAIHFPVRDRNNPNELPDELIRES
ncbi:MAG TPA: TPM domain-containing protein [Nitrospiraceae bacterium]|nr:TPM domain-containing protein [Nitrospiraceae bacterium]